MSTDPRTTVRDVVLADISAQADDATVQAIEDCAVSATEATCLNSHALLDFDEYREVAL